MKYFSENQNHIQVPPKKKYHFIAISILFSIALFFILGEIILRIVPFPGIDYNIVKYDPLVGVSYYPDAISHYRNDRGDFVKRKVNSYGFLDLDHKKEKEPGVYRIGFFGDSFTEARQVPLKNTFFRIIQQKLEEYNVQTLAFGHTGFGTVHSYLNSGRWSEFLALDMIVYVFVENDLGDQIQKIKKSPAVPYAILTNTSFMIDYTLMNKIKFKNQWYYKVIDFITANSLLMSTLSKRIKLLLRYGIKTNVTEEDRAMATKLKRDAVNNIPNQNDLPSTWPILLKDYATELGASIILKWKKEVEDTSKKFAIFYIPRELEFSKKTENQDSWKQWLKAFSREQNITFIDPSSDFLKMELSGKEVFYDHFTIDGHKAFADRFTKWFKDNHRNFNSLDQKGKGNIKVIL